MSLNTPTTIHTSSRCKRSTFLFLVPNTSINYIAGFNERFLTSVEVFDVTRGIWREFNETCPHKTKFQALQIQDDQILIIGGRDEVIHAIKLAQLAITTSEVEDFQISTMKSFPASWKLPETISGFSACQIKSKFNLSFGRGCYCNLWRK